jgi:uncharacterized protein (DUF1015 family)
MRPPRLFIANPPLAHCLAQSTRQQAHPPVSDIAGLQPFDQLARWQTETGSAPSANSFEAVRQDAARLRRLIGQAAHARRVPRNATLVYRLELGAHSQTGVVVEGSVEDYRRGRIRRHEATDPDRERRLVELLTVTELELLPLTLVHRTRGRLQTLLAEATLGEPAGRLGPAGGPTQSVWLVRRHELAAAIWDELYGLGSLYIADGHHRFAAAERYAQQHCSDPGESAACFVLAVLFPSDDVRVLGYHRCVARPGGSAASVLDAVAQQPVTGRIEECPVEEVPQPAPGVLVMCLDGRWHRVWLRSRGDTVDVRASLDVVALENGILGPGLGVRDRDEVPVAALPGSLDAQEVARRCAEQGMVGFLLHPPGIEQIMAVADAGLVMPPKSTWFDPKARPGLLIRDVRGGEVGSGVGSSGLGGAGAAREPS